MQLLAKQQIAVGAKASTAQRRSAARVVVCKASKAEGEMSRRAALGMAAGVAALASSAAPSLAAYGDGANVFGKVTNKSGFIPYVGEGFAVLLPSKWNPSREQDFGNIAKTELRYEDNGDSVNSISILTKAADKGDITGYGSPEKFLEGANWLFGQQAFAGETQSEGGFAPNRVAAASLLGVSEASDKQGKKYYRYDVLTRSADGDEGGRHILISATVSGGKLWICRIQIGDKRWIKGASKDATGSLNSFTERDTGLAVQNFSIDLDAIGLDIPDLGDEVCGHQEALGATFNDDDIAESFNNTGKVLEALTDGVALVDRSHWGRIRVGGPDRAAFLQNQSTADFRALAPGQGCDTVFVTATARCLDLATALVGENQIMLIVSPSMREALMQRFDKFIFPADKVEVSDVSSRCRMFTLVGPKAGDILRELGGDNVSIVGAPYGSHQLLGFRAGGAPVVAFASSGLALPGYTLIVDEAAAADMYAVLANKGCVPCGQEDWERARVTQGRPKAGAELTEDFNPLEAGLYHCVSTNKGCYIGQETISKLNNLDGVKQQLWGLQLSARAAPGDEVRAAGGGARVGAVTSVVNLLDSGHFGLAYLRCKSKGAQVDLSGTTVEVGGAPARVVPIPFATRSFAAAGQADAGVEQVSASLQERAEQARQEKEAAKAAADAAKADRLKAMQERLAAWQAQQEAEQQGQQGGQ
ncbi:MAG: hypothetical protein J3K34DRAFT_517910 [Monoraphidium minutum]|nr:MAG: hypothetical protein J3K34DRAFT_517910 [Monoraphidium minutum]